MMAPAEPAPAASTFEDVYRQELARLLPDEAVPPAEEVLAWVDARPPPLAALCLSGGGVRSASFALGVLQALARVGVLGHFHYLSTVSGGGYVGAWLTAFRGHVGDAAAFAALNQLQDTGIEPPEIGGIRENSNYLTPRLGVLSADTWEVLAQYVRNLLLNWLVFGPLLLALLMVPQLCARLLSEVAARYQDWHGALLAAAAAALLAGQSVAVCGRLRTRGRWLTDRWYIIGVLAPVVLAAVCLAGAARISQDAPAWWKAAIVTAAIYAAADAIGRGLAGTRPEKAADRTQVGAAASASWRQSLAWAVSGGLVGILVVIGIGSVARWLHGVAPENLDAILVIFGASWVVGAILVGELVYTGLSSYSARSDMDQEWLARSAGWMAAEAVTWALVAAIDLYGPWLLEQGVAMVATLLAGGVSGVVALVLGTGASSAATMAKSMVTRFSGRRLLGLAAIVFAVFLAVVLSWVDKQLCRLVDDALGDRAAMSLAMVAMTIGMTALSLAVSVPVNVNRFSLHALYRNRLIRAFLGSARGAARAGRFDPFTGFDPDDNVAMSATLHPAGGPARLLHTVNVALNVVSSRKLAWQERKAEAFSINALASGNPNVGYRPTSHYGAPNGISLGTATAISGAAVSPNQGYHSSPLIGFLLMLFNVRLGWWLGNPRDPVAARCSGPTIGLVPALQELAGATTDRGRWVYLSDGGHFDNLGIYEMVRRRCRLIVVSDAGCDPDTRFEDLGNAVRKCAIDFGIAIDFDVLDLPARRDASEKAGAYCAIGRITYPGGPVGWLLYVKPAYHGTESAAIRSYALTHPEFPHETTRDQWFSESQFEAYRALGAHIFAVICADAARAPQGQQPDLAHLRAWVENYMHDPGGRAAPVDS